MLKDEAEDVASGVALKFEQAKRIKAHISIGRMNEIECFYLQISEITSHRLRRSDQYLVIALFTSLGLRI